MDKTWRVLKRYDGDHLTRIALPLGGIGTGTVSLGGRGDLRDWEIMNRPSKGYTPCADGGRPCPPSMVISPQPVHRPGSNSTGPADATDVKAPTTAAITVPAITVLRSKWVMCVPTSGFRSTSTGWWR